jgi:hypothetical protein
MKPWALAAFAAVDYLSSSVASNRRRYYSITVPVKRFVSCKKSCESERLKSLFFILFMFIAVVAYLAVGYVVKPVYKVCYSRFACARCAHKRNLLPGLCVQGYIVKHVGYAVKAEIDVEETDVALSSVSDSPNVSAVGMLPRTIRRCVPSFRRAYRLPALR